MSRLALAPGARLSSATLTLVAALALLLAGGTARGQACCAGSTAFAPARLALHEDYLVGLVARTGALYGSFDGGYRFVPSPTRDSEVDLEQDLIAAIRLFRRLQIATTVPFVETFRSVPGRTEMGGGIGDLQLTFRYDFTLAGASRRIPGIAVVTGGTFPTGKASSAAAQPLATDATGLGAFQISQGLAVEQAFGPWLVNLTGALTWRSPVDLPNVNAQQGLQWSLFAAVAYTFKSDVALAVTAAYTAELDAKVNGVTVPASARSFTRLTAAVGYEFARHYRFQASLYSDLPIRYLGSNQPLGAGGAFMMVRSW